MTNRPEHSSEEAIRLKAVFEDAIDGIITIDEKGNIESINPAAARLFDYLPDEVIGRNVNMLMPEPYHSQHDGYLNNYHTSGNKKIIGIGREVIGKKKDGSTFPFFLSVSEIQLKTKKIYTGIIHDITELKEKEKELEESRNKLSAIFETAVDGIIIINRQGYMTMTNPAVSRLFGYTAEEMLGQNVRMLMPDPHRANHDSYMENYHKTGEAKIIGIGREVHGRRKDGTLFPLNLGVSEIVSDGEIMYTGILHDLTDQKLIEKEIRQLNESLEDEVSLRTAELTKTVNKLLSTNSKLEFEIREKQRAQEALLQSKQDLAIALKKERELNELKSRFVSMASHEFRTPLSTILSSAALIGKYTNGEQQEKRIKHIDRIKSAVNNLTGILNDFLSLSKLEEGKIDNQPEPFDFNILCGEIAEDIQGLLKEGQKIEHSADQQTPVTLDRRIMKNILFNLMSNAIKYSPENSTIFCQTLLKDNELIINIKDEGMGIPKPDQEYLFTRFFRATNVTNIQGTGLGLNIVKRYVDLMNGNISFESEEGKGSVFTIKIPQNQ